MWRFYLKEVYQMKTPEDGENICVYSLGNHCLWRRLHWSSLTIDQKKANEAASSQKCASWIFEARIFWEGAAKKDNFVFACFLSSTSEFKPLYVYPMRLSNERGWFCTCLLFNFKCSVLAITRRFLQNLALV